MSHTPVITFTMNPAVDVFGETGQIFDDSKTRCRQTAVEPGGGGINVARNIRRMGSPTLAVFPSGGLHGEQLQRLLNEDKQPFIAIPIGGDSRQNMAITDLSRKVMHHFVFPGPDLTDKEMRACHDTLLKYNPPFLVLSGSLPDHVQQDFYAQVTEAAASAGSKVLLDTSGAALTKSFYHGAYLAKLNRREFASLGFDEHSSVQQLHTDMQTLVAEGAVEVLIVTLTRGGALLVDNTGRSLHFSAPKVPIVSHVGAGDSFMSALTHQLMQGAPLERAFKYGVAAACVTVQCEGNQLTDFDWVERTLDEIQAEDI